MSAKSKSTSISITEKTGPQKAPVLCFNRFKVQQDGPFAVITLAFAQGGFTLNSAVMIVPLTAVEATKSSVLDYLDRVRGKIGDAEPDKPTDINSAQQPAIYYGNHLGFGHAGQLAQIRLMSFDLKDLAAPNAKAVDAERVATFEMPTTTQMGIITALYVRK